MWLIDKLNNQQNEGPAEKIGDYINEAGKPELIMVSIGATRYTDFGEHNFLANGDKSVVVVYPEDKYSSEDIKKGVENNSLNDKDVSVLSQLVVL